MSNGWVPLVIAIVGGGGPLVYFLERLDRRNTNQHTNNLDLLKDIQSDVHDVKKDIKTIDKRLDSHIDWHSRNNEH